ncbi:MAG: tRNA 2-thiouridine(34) synthase MnmA [Coriobacteriales bacterium]|jgi:tRNA-specific 2-thiouridylase|nr:tRNA 2-thiouridine(34) synthase MnmA [Coriobacteriales bacterium]
MSGGVDSSVAAALLQHAGYQCTGVTMKLLADPPETAAVGGCCGLEAALDAKRVCAALDIPHYTLNYVRQFNNLVIQSFVDAYCRGETPNPCIACNRFMKFELLMNWARQMGFDCLATGHYARLAWDEPSRRHQLRKATDTHKDQSYVLYPLTQTKLAFLRLPLGGLRKQQVRSLAAEFGLPTAHKAESQDICFVSNGTYPRFICQELRRQGRPLPSPGAFIDTQGQILGSHQGIHNFTVGQRRGLGVAMGHPLYVRALDATSATVVLAEREQMVFTTALISDVYFIARPHLNPEQNTRARHAAVSVKARPRYRSTEEPALAQQLSDGRIQVRFTRPQSALAKGQALVLYEDDTVLAGGTISAAF